MLSQQLSSLLQRLDQFQASGRDFEPGERQLIDQLGRKLFKVADEASQANRDDKDRLELQMQQQSARANLMRYSTPNLLLSSNFEHILRQTDMVSWVR